MTNDQKTSISGLIAAIGIAIAAFFPSAGPTIQAIATAVSALALAVLGYYTNKSDTP